MIKKYFIPHHGNDYKPHILRESAVAGLLALSIGVFFTFSLVLPQIEKLTQTAAIYSAVLVASANSDRADLATLPSLSVNPLLERAAQMKANDMAEKGYFAHNSPQGLTPWYWIQQVGYKYEYAGENLAVDFTDSNDVEQAWLNSPTHRANILNNHYTEIGIATAKGEYNGRQTIFAVQMFGSPKLTATAVAVAAAPTPTPIVSHSAPVTKPAPSKTIKNEQTPTTSTSTFLASAKVEGDSIAPTVAAAEITAASEEPTWFQKLLVNPSKALRMIYLALILLMLVSLTLFVFIEWKVQHPKNIAYALLLLVIVSSLFYINWILFVAPLAIA